MNGFKYILIVMGAAFISLLLVARTSFRMRLNFVSRSSFGPFPVAPAVTCRTPAHLVHDSSNTLHMPGYLGPNWPLEGLIGCNRK